MSLGYETQVVNGQMVNVAPAQGYSPLTFGAAYTGPGYWPRNGAYNVPPVVPSTSSMSAASNSGTGLGGQPMPTAGAMRSDGTINFMHPTKSPLLWAFAFLFGGLLLLHHVHYK